jgi:tetratricopeptide (TPR) repeat protein
MQALSVPLDKLAAVFKYRPDLADLWRLVESGAAELSPAQQVDLTVAEARAYYLAGQSPESLAVGQRALAMAQALDYRKGCAAALAGLAQVHRWMSNLERGAQLAQESLDYAGDIPESIQALTTLGGCAFETNDWSASEQYYDRAIQLGRELGQAFFLAAAVLDLSLLTRDWGHFAQSLAMLDEYQHILLQIGFVSDRYAMGRSWIHLIVGDRARAREAIAELRAFTATSPGVAAT